MDARDERQTVVVIGNGMTCHALCQKLAHCGATRQNIRLVVFGEEPVPAYDRVHLSGLLSGRSEEDLLLSPIRWYADHGIALYLGDPVVFLDRSACVVRSRSGITVVYDRLIFATGSRPFLPAIRGIHLPGVFAYRSLADLRSLRDSLGSARRAAVMGGGLLGLEAAGAVHVLGIEVHVLERSERLLARQLDATGARLVQTKLEALGVRVHTGARLCWIESDASDPTVRAERLLGFEDGRQLAVDQVIVAAGIRPRDELARTVGLTMATAGGIVVDDHLTTSDPRIFAVGECAAHRGMTYGLAPPGLRMVDVLVDNLAGGNACFEGAAPSVRLKVQGVDVAVLGQPDEHASPGRVAYTFFEDGVYRKLVLEGGRLIGAAAVGTWEDLPRVEDALLAPMRVSYWDLRRFRVSGMLFQASASLPVYAWPPDALVCGCMTVRRGDLSGAEADGCTSVEALTASTGAGSMCGSCKPLLDDFLAHQHAAPMRSSLIDPPVTLRAATRDPGLDVAIPPPVLHGDNDTTPIPSTRRAVGAHVRHSEKPHSTSGAHERLPASSRRDARPPLRSIPVPSMRLPSATPVSQRTNEPLEARHRVRLLALAVASLAGCVVTLMAPVVPAARSFQRIHLDLIMTDPGFRRGTGYGVVGLALASLVLSARKRLKRFEWSSAHALRVVHGVLGTATLLGLWAHTGLRLGERLHLALTLDVLGVVALGGLASAAFAAPLDPWTAQRWRLRSRHAHMVLLLPLPALVVLHMLGAYYF